MDFYILALGPEASTPEFAVNLWRKISIVLFCLHTDTGPTRTNWSWISILSKIAHHAHYASECEPTCYCRLTAQIVYTQPPKVSPLMMTPLVVFLLSPLDFSEDSQAALNTQYWTLLEAMVAATAAQVNGAVAQPQAPAITLHVNSIESAADKENATPSNMFSSLSYAKAMLRKPNQMSRSSHQNHLWRRSCSNCPCMFSYLSYYKHVLI